MSSNYDVYVSSATQHPDLFYKLKTVSDSITILA